MKRADVKRSYHQGAEGLPMVNVKTHCSGSELQQRIVRAAEQNRVEFDSEHADEFLAWLPTAIEGEHGEVAWEAACEHGWDDLQNDANNVFGDRATVEPAGRSNGWCVVRGLPDVETWGAVTLGKWAQFCKYAAQDVANLPFAMADFLYHNVFLPPIEAAERAHANDADAARFMAL